VRPGVTKPNGVCDTPWSHRSSTRPFSSGRLAFGPRSALRWRKSRALAQGRRTQCGPLFWHYPHYSNQGSTPAGASARETGNSSSGTKTAASSSIIFANDRRDQERRYREPPSPRSFAQAWSAWRREVHALMPTNTELPRPKTRRRNQASVLAPRPHTLASGFEDSSRFMDRVSPPAPRQVIRPEVPKVAALQTTCAGVVVSFGGTLL